MAYILANATQKGGVGKTTSTVNLADAFVRRGRRVLVIDLDPQGNATSVLNDVNPSTLRYTTTELILDGDPAIASACIRPTRIDGLDMVASSIRLARASETELIRRNTTTLSKRLELLKEVYDIILIDCPPNLGRLTGNALCAATHYLVPLKGGDIYSLDGFDDLETTVKEARDDNPKLARLGVFFNIFDGRKNVAKLLARTATERFGNEMFTTRLPETVAFQEAAVLCKTVLEMQRDGTAAKAVVELGDEILARLDARGQHYA